LTVCAVCGTVCAVCAVCAIVQFSTAGCIVLSVDPSTLRPVSSAAFDRRFWHQPKTGAMQFCLRRRRLLLLLLLLQAATKEEVDESGPQSNTDTMLLLRQKGKKRQSNPIFVDICLLALSPFFSSTVSILLSVEQKWRRMMQHSLKFSVERTFNRKDLLFSLRLFCFAIMN
jgi:hypothetical protein